MADGDAAAAPHLAGHAAVVTLGARGAAWAADEHAGSATPPTVDAVDSTGAGDSFLRRPGGCARGGRRLPGRRAPAPPALSPPRSGAPSRACRPAPRSTRCCGRPAPPRPPADLEGQEGDRCRRSGYRRRVPDPPLTTLH
ncbi:MAG: hypothetical protein H0V05_12980, partial [Euzebyaceae bacterium]|nr:hypothetical protein [Euzebyaceae bacterium]